MRSEACYHRSTSIPRILIFSMKRIVIATLIGATVAFLWGFVSWELLPWHRMDRFEDHAAVAKVIKENAPAHGLYLMPTKGQDGPNAEAITEGPFIYAVVRPGKLDTPWKMSTHLICSYGIQLAGALIIAIAIYRIRATRYLSRASVGPAMGLFAGLTMTLPHWNWLGLPGSDALVHILDPLIGWTLAGLCIAAIIKPPRTRRIFT